MPKVTPKWSQSVPKVSFICQKWPQSNPESTQNSPRSFIKWFKSVGKMNVFWKRTLIHQKWLHNDFKVILQWPKWPKVTHRHPKLPQSGPKTPWARSAVRGPGVAGPVLTKQNPLQICVFLLYGPAWSEHKAIWYALSVKFDVYLPKVTPKWSQSGPKVSFICQKWPQSNPESTQNLTP